MIFQQVRYRYYEFDGTLSKDGSGYLFNYQDRRENRPFVGTKVNQTGLVSLKENCETHMMCGMPLYDYRYFQNRMTSKFLPRSEPIVPPGTLTFELLNKTMVNSTTCRLEFSMSGSNQMSLFFQTEPDVKIVDWSFLRSHLATPQPYHIWFTHGIDDSPLKFSIDIWVRNTLISYICFIN